MAVVSNTRVYTVTAWIDDTMGFGMIPIDDDIRAETPFDAARIMRESFELGGTHVYSVHVMHPSDR